MDLRHKKRGRWLVHSGFVPLSNCQTFLGVAVNILVHRKEAGGSVPFQIVSFLGSLKIFWCIKIEAGGSQWLVPFQIVLFGVIVNI